MARRLGLVLVAVALLAALGAPLLAPHASDDAFPDFSHAPPTVPHLFAGGRLHAPFIYRWQLESRLEQRYRQDLTARIALRWFRGGRIVQSSDERRAPLLLFGGDSYGRDVLSRLLFGARVSIALSIAAALGALLLGAAAGSVAGYLGGSIDDVLMRTTDMALVLPPLYLALALRAVLPAVLPPAAIFLFLTLIFAVLGAPLVSRGVRAIVRAERESEYASAAVSLGAGHARLLGRHLLPAARGYLAVQATVLIPAFIVAEATLSYVGFGFNEPVASWGTMLQQAARVRSFADFPWLLSPAIAIFLFVLGVNLLLEGPRVALHENAVHAAHRRPDLDGDAVR